MTLDYLPGIPARLLTVDQVAELLNISRRTVYSLMTTGQIQSLKIGGSRRIEPAVVEQFVAVRRKESAGP